ncbi:claudin 9, partial [Chelydra serpentina]
LHRDPSPSRVSLAGSIGIRLPAASPWLAPSGSVSQPRLPGWLHRDSSPRAISFRGNYLELISTHLRFLDSFPQLIPQRTGLLALSLHYDLPCRGVSGRSPHRILSWASLSAQTPPRSPLRSRWLPPPPPPAMASAGLQILGMALCVFGWLGSLIACALPTWKVTAFIGNNIVTAQTIWEGLWMSCVVQSTGQMQCKVYDSMLALPQDLQAARALMVVSVLLAVLALLVSVVGAKCTNCVEDEGAKARIMIVSGAVFVVAGVLCLIPVSWSANTVIRDFYNPLVAEALKRELGAALYVGWAAAALLVLGGALLCCSCPPRTERYPPRVGYVAAARSGVGSGVDKRDYV